MFKESKRKNYLINPKFQISFILFSVVNSFLGMFVFLISNKYFFWSIKKMGNEQGIPNDHIFFRFIDDQNYKMNFILLISSFIVFLISLIGALILSHRVAGPVYRLKMHLDSSVLTGEKKEVTFRKGDFFMELQDAFNEYIKRSKN